MHSKETAGSSLPIVSGYEEGAPKKQPCAHS